MYYDIGHYGTFMIAWNALPPYPEWSRRLGRRVGASTSSENEPYLLKWLEQPDRRRRTGGNGSVGGIADRIDCPAFLIGGWRDGYPNPPLRLYAGAAACRRRCSSGRGTTPCPTSAIPGPRIDYLHEVVRWLDHWCKGRDTGIMDEPPVVVYMQP